MESVPIINPFSLHPIQIINSMNLHPVPIINPMNLHPVLIINPLSPHLVLIINPLNLHTIQIINPMNLRLSDRQSNEPPSHSNLQSDDQHDYSDVLTPCTYSLLTDLYNEQYRQLSKTDLEVAAERIFIGLSITDEECKQIQKSTCLQSKSDEWKRQRNGRL